MKRRSITLSIFVIALATVTGCGSGSSTVKGKVTSGGKPVVWGTVILVDASGEYHQGTIDLNGNYEIAGVPKGGVKIGVTSPKPPDGKSKDGKPTPAGGGGKEGAKGGGGAPGFEDPREKFIASQGGTKAAELPPPPPGAWFPLPNPNVNGDPLQSGLTGEVKSGQPLDIDVK